MQHAKVKKELYCLCEQEAAHHNDWHTTAAVKSVIRSHFCALAPSGPARLPTGRCDSLHSNYGSALLLCSTLETTVHMVQRQTVGRSADITSRKRLLTRSWQLNKLFYWCFLQKHLHSLQHLINYQHFFHHNDSQRINVFLCSKAISTFASLLSFRHHGKSQHSIVWNHCEISKHSVNITVISILNISQVSLWR